MLVHCYKGRIFLRTSRMGLTCKMAEGAVCNSSAYTKSGWKRGGTDGIVQEKQWAFRHAVGSRVETWSQVCSLITSGGSIGAFDDCSEPSTGGSVE